jgi:hypothetical protein
MLKNEAAVLMASAKRRTMVLVVSIDINFTLGCNLLFSMIYWVHRYSSRSRFANVAIFCQLI